MTALEVQPSGQSCGAVVRGVDLRRIDHHLAADLRSLWLEHLVLAFPDQDLDPEHLARLAAAFGPYGDDPFIDPIPGHPHVIEVRREPEETSRLFAEFWHSDWSFLATPPAGTLLYGVEIPPQGGDTLFADQYAAYCALPTELAERIATLRGVHSARHGYAPDGLFGDGDQGRSMAIRPSDAARATQTHPLVRVHPETGRPALFANLSYTIGVEGLDHDAGMELLVELHGYGAAEAVQYRHRWSPGMLTLWDNRCLMHMATGGYDGHRRLLHRVTVGERPAVPAP